MGETPIDILESLDVTSSEEDMAADWFSFVNSSSK